MSMQKFRQVQYAVAFSIMRHYEEIWVRLKELSKQDAGQKGISVTANRLLHPRIIKAVIKEKWKDLGFKILMHEDRYRVVLTHTRKNSILTFYLTYIKVSLTEKDF